VIYLLIELFCDCIYLDYDKCMYSIRSSTRKKRKWRGKFWL